MLLFLLMFLFFLFYPKKYDKHFGFVI